MKLLSKKKQQIDTIDYTSIRISLASPEKIKEMSYGEVKKTETLNYRTLKPERDGLFCEKIFGPVKDYECSCGKYKKSVAEISKLTKPKECERCGVEITTSKVRRERMGHITLAVPVAHFWYFGRTPSKMAIFLDMLQDDVKNIVYGISWVVVKDIDDIKNVIINILKDEKDNESQNIRNKIISQFGEEKFNKILQDLEKIKIPLPKKTVIEPNNNDPKRFIEYLQSIFRKSPKTEALNEFVRDASYDIFRELARKIANVLTNDEKFIGKLTDEKNYLKENVSILTNAEALYRLLKVKEEELEQEIVKIKEMLRSLSQSENISRISTLFEKYRDVTLLEEDLSELDKIIKNLATISRSKEIRELDLQKSIEQLKNSQDQDKSIQELYSKVTKVKNELIKHIDKINTEISDALYNLFEKYNIYIQPSPLRSKLITRLRMIEKFLKNNIKPEWMILTVLPVLPPDLRPLVPIEGGKFASSDLNEFYRRIIHRNNRLKRFFGHGPEKSEYIGSGGIPKLILLNEKRLLQEAVDALIENSARKHPLMSSQKRPLKSLTDILKGKQGRFRQNLLGKRIDYSGRSVIVPAPELKLYQCGLPKEMAFELFKPFIYHKLIKKYGVTLKKAKVLAEKKGPEIWDIVEEITKHHPVLLNRAPTLHRPSIQAFEPVLVEGKAIQIHPMVCTPYNADFDGDQMAVYVPLTLEALAEAKLLMTSYFNTFSPANGTALIGPTQDVVLGIAYLTTEKPKEKGEGRIFSSVEEAIYNYQQKLIALNAKIKVLGINDFEINKMMDEMKKNNVDVEKIITESVKEIKKSGKNVKVAIKDVVSKLINDYLKFLENKYNIVVEGNIIKDIENVIEKTKIDDVDDKIIKGIIEHILEGHPEIWLDYTTIGRIIFNSILPIEISLLNPNLPQEEKQKKNKPFGKKDLVNLIKECHDKCGAYSMVVFLDELKKLGYHYATLSGFTISLDDMIIPESKFKKVEQTWEKIKEVEEQAKNGIITESERYNAVVDIWSTTIDEIVKEMEEKMIAQIKAKYKEGESRFNSVYFMASSGARGNMDQVKQLSVMRGLMSRPQRKISGEVGEIIETPVISSFREGLSVLEYFISTYGGRKGLSDTALKTSEAGYLTRRLVDATHSVVITEHDCGTVNGITVSALKVGGEVLIPLRERLAGRVAASNITYEVKDEKTGEVVVKTIKEGELITEAQAEEIEKVEFLMGPIKIRSVLTCESKTGVCAKCYGMDLSTGELVRIGEPVGIIAAQSIGEPGTQLTLRTFHIGGAAARLTKQSNIKAPADGRVKYNFKTVTKKDETGKTVHIVVTSDAYLQFIYAQQQEEKTKEVWMLHYGARVYVNDGDFVKKGDLIADWDVYSIPIICEKSGRVKYRDLYENKTYVVETRSGGRKEMRVLPYKGGKYKIGIDIINEKGKIIATYPLPADTIIMVEDGQEVSVGDVLGKIPKEEITTKDITGGLPRVEELFEARHPQNPAVLSEIDGRVYIETKEDGKISIKVVNEQSKKEKRYDIPPGRIPLVYEGDRVEAGEPLTDGVIDPHKYLEIRGRQHLQEFLLNEIQEVYRLQGVNINDKHIEIVIRQMLSFVRITDPGNPPQSTKDEEFYEFINGEIVPKKLFDEEVRKVNEYKRRLLSKGLVDEANRIRPAKAEHVLLGITTVASSSESFLSAASFQETPRVLTEAALSGKIDYLTGLKENVIIGHLIPAGTGIYSEEVKMLKEGTLKEELQMVL